MKFKIENIILNLNVKTKNDVLKKISEHAFENKITTKQKKLFNAFLTREKAYSTGFEDGFAIPHARSKYILEPAIIYAKFNGITWPSIDDEPTNIAIALLVPSDKAGEIHMDTLSKIAAGLSKKELKNKLQNANTKKEIFEIINNVLEK